MNNIKVYLKRSNELNQDQKPKSPQVNDLGYGELALNYKQNYETLFMKNDNDEIISFLPNTVYEHQFNTMLSLINELSNKIESLQTEIDNLKNGN